MPRALGARDDGRRLGDNRRVDEQTTEAGTGYTSRIEIPRIISPSDQAVVWFLGHLERIRVDGTATDGSFPWWRAPGNGVTAVQPADRVLIVPEQEGRAGLRPGQRDQVGATRTAR
jgi:hypothetical protein